MLSLHYLKPSSEHFAKWIIVVLISVPIFGYGIYKAWSAVTAQITLTSANSISGLVAHYTFDGKYISSTNVTDGLVSHWKLDEGAGVSAADSTGNANTGTLTNGPTWTTGNRDNAVSFDGVNDYINVGTPASLNLSGANRFTLAAWVYPTSAPNGVGVITEMFTPTNTTVQYEIGFDINNGAPNNSNPKVGFYDGTTWYVAQQAVNVSLNVWTHIAGTWDGTTLRLYINGSEVATNAPAGPPSLPSADFDNVSIGRLHNTAGSVNYFPGKIDDARVYNRALSATEITTLYNYASSTVSDTSGSGYTATSTSVNRAVGAIGEAIRLNGANDFVSASNIGNINSVSFWVNTASTTQKMINLNATTYVENVSGTITATGFTSPTIYIDGAVTSTLTSGWHHVVITTGTVISASAVNIGRVGTNYLSGTVDDARFYSRAITSDEVGRLYKLGGTTKINKTLARAGETISQGLMAHWSFDATTITSTTASDISGNGKTGTVIGTTTSTYTATGTDLFTVPTGISIVEVKAWGGGAGGAGGGDVSAGGAGGGGGFMRGTVPVTGGESLTVYVGGGGGFGTGRSPTASGDGGGGAGYSGISRSGMNLILAAGAGGGGGGDNTAGAAAGGAGGVGGGATGGTGGSSGTATGGGGGTQSAGGAAGVNSGTGSGVAGSSLTGGAGAQGQNGSGNGCNNTLFGGGGTAGSNGGGAGGLGNVTAGCAGGGGAGGGYFGGGGGGPSSATNAGGGGGGGGSSFATSTASATSTSSGSGTAPGNNSDSDYAGSAGVGGAAGGIGANGVTGNPGRVVVKYIGTLASIGRLGQALTFDGSAQYISVGNVGTGAQTVAFWVNTSSTTQKIIDLNATAYVENVSGTITATGFTSPTIYIDGAVSSTLTSGWHYVVITTATGINASAVNIGKVTSYFNGTLDDVRIYSRAISSDEVTRLYKLGATTKVNVTLERPGDSLESGLVGHWTMDGKYLTPNVRDRSTSANHGNLTGQAATTTAIGKIGQAMQFDGVDDYINIGDIAAVDTATTFSSCAWVKHDTLTDDDAIIAKFATDGPLLFRDDVASVSGRTDTYAAYVADSADADEARVEGATNASVARVWTHVCMTYQASISTGLRLYVNGVEDVNSPASTASVASIDAGTASLRIGATAEAGIRPFNGSIDDSRIYTRILSAAEITRLYQMGK